jgi:uncharacterized protein (DUF1499 family)
MADDMKTRSVALCQAFTVLLVLQLIAAPMATRFGLISYKIGLPLTALAVLGGVLLLIASLLMLLVYDFRMYRGRLIVSALLASMPVAAGIAMVAPSAGLPVIHDVSTDLADPPMFNLVIELRGGESNPLARNDEIDAAQSAAYPDVRSIASPLAPAEALQRAEATARALGWAVHAVDADAGTVEASETTFWYGFTDDIAIRVRATETGSVIDLRSVSRVGRGDLGANARRIRNFSAAFASG